MTAGIVSAHGRDIGSGPYDYMQIDAAVNRGNSGGPTFNLDGEVVGVNTAIYSPSGGNVGIAFAIPAKTATEVVDAAQDRRLRQARLARRARSRTSTRTRRRASGSARPRARWSARSPPGPAAEAGLKNGDAILSVNGNKVADSRDLARQIAGFSPGAKVDVQHPARPEGADRRRQARHVPVRQGAGQGRDRQARRRAAGDRAGPAGPDAWRPAPAPTRTAWWSPRSTPAPTPPRRASSRAT